MKENNFEKEINLWNKNKKGTNSNFLEIGNLIEINYYDEKQAEALTKKYPFISNIEAKALLSMANYDEQSFFFMFDTSNGNFVEIKKQNENITIVDVATPESMLSYLDDEIKYRLENQNKIDQLDLNTSFYLSSLKEKLNSYKLIDWSVVDYDNQNASYSLRLRGILSDNAVKKLNLSNKYKYSLLTDLDNNKNIKYTVLQSDDKNGNPVVDDMDISFETLQEELTLNIQSSVNYFLTNKNLKTINNTIKLNFNWDSFNETEFNKLKEDIKKGIVYSFYGSVYCGELCTDIQNNEGDKRIFLEHYYPDQEATYGETDGGLRYDAVPGNIISDFSDFPDTFSEFKTWLEEKITESVIDYNIMDKADKPYKSWRLLENEIFLNEESNITPKIISYIDTEEKLIEQFEKNNINITEQNAENILKFITYENYVIYLGKDKSDNISFHIIDASEDFTGEGECLTPQELIEFALSQALKAEDLNYELYNKDSIDDLKFLSEKTIDSEKLGTHNEYFNNLKKRRELTENETIKNTNDNSPVNIIENNLNLSPSQLQGEKYLGELSKNIGYYKNNPWLTTKVILDDMKKNNYEEYNLLQTFFKENNLCSKESFEHFWSKNIGTKKIKYQDIEKKQDKKIENDVSVER